MSLPRQNGGPPSNHTPLQWQPGERPPYAFCESATVATAAPWHIRKVGEVGLKLGGGIDTPSLCDRVRPLGVGTPHGFGGWDLNARITEHHLRHSCKSCVAAYLTEINK